MEQADRPGGLSSVRGGLHAKLVPVNDAVGTRTARRVRDAASLELVQASALQRSALIGPAVSPGCSGSGLPSD